MSTDATPDIVQVPVKRYDVNLTLDDILTPLTQTASHVTQPGAAGQPNTVTRLAAAGAGGTANPELAQHLQTLSELAGQIKDVVSKINQIDPTLLAPTSGQSPKA